MHRRIFAIAIMNVIDIVFTTYWLSVNSVLVENNLFFRLFMLAPAFCIALETIIVTFFCIMMWQCEKEYTTETNVAVNVTLIACIMLLLHHIACILNAFSTI